MTRSNRQELPVQLSERRKNEETQDSERGATVTQAGAGRGESARQNATRWMSAEGQACPDASYLENSPEKDRGRGRGRGRGDQQRWLPRVGGSELRLDSSGSVRGWGVSFVQTDWRRAVNRGCADSGAFRVDWRVAGVAKPGSSNKGRPCTTMERERWRTGEGSTRSGGCERAGGLDCIY